MAWKPAPFGNQYGKKHGKTNSPTYGSWEAMRQRCLNVNHRAYPDYGGRGIEICERWNSFENFLSDMGERPPGKTIDRKNNDGNYEPGNCRWATPTEQLRKSRRNHNLTLNVETKCLSEWCEIRGIAYSTLSGRIRSGWTIERALSK